MLKTEIRILGFDDGAFEFRSKQPVPVIGIIFRGGKFLDGALRTDVEVDGTDATEKIVKLINASRHKNQLKVIMFDGITLAGFNVVDVKKLNEETDLPVIVINRKKPNLEKVKNALKNFKDFKTRWQAIENAGKIKECYIKDFKKVYYQNVGIGDDVTREIIKMSCTRGFIPEPLRVAHLIATAVVRGESYGRA
ncbi:MAG: endonuclease dU [Candidatus Heimdallarchaeota archaeon]